MSGVATTIRRCPPGVLVLVFLLAALVGAQGSTAFPLLDVDEPRFAQASRTMLETGDWLVPHFGGEVRYDKPALIYWLQAASFWAFGIGPGPARLPSALGVAVAAMLTAWLAFRRTGRTATAWAAGAVLATCVQAQVMAHGSTADALMLACTTLSVTGIILRAEGERGPRSFLMTWGGLGLGLLAKGPPALVPVLAVAAARIRRGVRPGWSGLMGLGLALLIPLLWFIPVNLATDWGFVTRGLGHHVLARSLQPFENHGGFAPQWYLFYPAVVGLMFLPWSVFLPAALRDFWRRRHTEPLWFRLGAFWVGGVVLLFTVVTSKLPHYVLPMYPLLAIEVARYLDRVAALPQRGAALVLVLLGVAAPVGIVVAMAHADLLDLWQHVVGVLVMLAMLGLGGAVLLWRGLVRASAGYLALAMTLLLGTLTVDALSMLWQPRFLGTALVDQLAAVEGAQDQVFFLDLDLPSAVFRRNRPIVWPDPASPLEPPAQAVEFLQQRRGWLVTRKDRLDGVVRAAQARGATELLARLAVPAHAVRAFDPNRGRVLELVLIR